MGVGRAGADDWEALSGNRQVLWRLEVVVEFEAEAEAEVVDVGTTTSR